MQKKKARSQNPLVMLVEAHGIRRANAAGARVSEDAEIRTDCGRQLSRREVSSGSVERYGEGANLVRTAVALDAGDAVAGRKGVSKGKGRPWCAIAVCRVNVGTHSWV